MSTDDDIEEETHPSYALASFSRVRGRPGALFGSALGAVHGTFIRFQVLPALRMHRLKSDSYHAESLTPLIEFDMSAAQFAELITTLNMGSGVPCTLRRLDGREIPRPPEDAQGEAGRVRSSYEADIKNLGKKVRAYAQQIMTLVKTLPAARKREVEIALECIEQQLGSNSTFALDRFVDATERVETASKAEVEAFLTHALTSAGLVALREQVPKLETESGGEARRLQGVVPCAGRCHGANAASSLPHACTYKNNVGTGCMCSCCEACTMACAQDP